MIVMETIPSVLYILARHGNDPEEAIVRAVNDTRDNDTVAAIVGAAVGAPRCAPAAPSLARGPAGADRGRRRRAGARADTEGAGGVRVGG